MAEDTTQTTPTENDENNQPQPQGKEQGGDATPTSEEKQPEAQPKEGFIPKDRFNDVVKERNELRKQQEEFERKQLEEKEQFESLYQKEKEQREALENKYKDTARRTAFLKAVHGKDVVDADDVYALAQEELNKLEITEDGNVDGLDEVIDSLLEKKPYLVKKGSGTVGSPTTPPNGDQPNSEGTKTWTTAEVAALSPKQFAENKQDIHKAYKEGRIQ